MKPRAFLPALTRAAAPALILTAAITMGGAAAHADDITAPDPSGAPTASADTSSTAPQSISNPSAQSSSTPIPLGVFGQNPQRTQQFESAVGHQVQVLTVFPTRESGWESIMDPWWLNTAPPGFTGTLDVGIPLFPTGSNLDEAAAGAHNARWEELGRLIVTKYPDAYVRIGWEANIYNWEWKATDDTVEQSKQAYRQAATALKRGGPKLRTQWVVNSGVGNSLAEAPEITNAPRWRRLSGPARRVTGVKSLSMMQGATAAGDGHVLFEP